MPEISFDVFCDRCGAGLCNNTTVDSGLRGVIINIEPCEQCLNDERSEGYDEGFKQGHDK